MPASSLPDLIRTRTLFEHWRATRPHRTPIPEELWQATLALCDRYSVSRLCRELRLSASSLRARLRALPKKSSPAPGPLSPPTFVALPTTDLSLGPTRTRPTPSSSASPVHLQLERCDGTRLLLSLPEAEWTQIESLCTAFLRV